MIAVTESKCFTVGSYYDGDKVRDAHTYLVPYYPKFMKLETLSTSKFLSYCQFMHILNARDLAQSLVYDFIITWFHESPKILIVTDTYSTDPALIMIR